MDKFNDILSFFYFNVPVLYALTLFFFGCAVGSFLNVAIYRMPKGINLISPPSTCPRCGNRIFGLDNVPLLSWVILKGKCRRCKTPIHWRYPVVELVTGLLWASVGWLDAMNQFGMWQNIAIITVHLTFVSFMVAITLIDYDFQIIPDTFSIGGFVIVLVFSGFLPELHRAANPEIIARFSSVPGWAQGLICAFAGALVGGGLILLLNVFGTIAFRGRIKKAQEKDPDITTAIGLGDVKLMAFAGALLGWKALIAAFFVGTCLGAILGLFDKFGLGRWPTEGEEVKPEFFMERIFFDFAPLPRSWRVALVCRWQTGESVMPFGPPLAIGCLVMLFFREPMIKFFAALLVPQANA